jgi:hypothetical protein
LRERATELLADHSNTVHPRLQPLFDAWMSGNRSQTTLIWLGKPSSSTDILRAMALGELPISHAAFDDLPCNRRVNYIRDLLAATGVIEPYQPLITGTTHSVLAELLGISPTTASRWAALSARTWAQYTAMRRNDQPHRAPADHDHQSRKPL